MLRMPDHVNKKPMLIYAKPHSIGKAMVGIGWSVVCLWMTNRASSYGGLGQVWPVDMGARRHCVV